MNERDIIINYLNDIRDDPNYNKVKRSYFMEMSWLHWAVDELIYQLKLYSNINTLDIVQKFKKESLIDLGIAKTDKGKDIFRTAFYLGIEMESFLRAMKGE